MQHLADYLGDVNALHPFREGNGRAQRLLFTQLAADAGYDLRWQHIDAQRNIAVSIASARGDERQLRELVEQITEPLGAQRQGTARALQAAYAERDQLARERGQLPDAPATRPDTRRLAYGDALARTTAVIAELEAANGGPLTAAQTVALKRDDQATRDTRIDRRRDVG